MSLVPTLLLAPLAATVAERLHEALGGLGRLAQGVSAAGPLAGAALLAAGIVALTVALRAPRPLAAAGGAIVGALAGLAVKGTLALHFGLAPLTSAVAGAAVVALACGAFPPLFPFAVGALPGALLGVLVPLGGRGVLGAAAGALVAGVVALVFGRPLTAGFAAVTGGLLAGAGLLALLGGSPLARELGGRPFALLGFAVVTGIAGAAFQLARREGPAGGSSPARTSLGDEQG